MDDGCEQVDVDVGSAADGDSGDALTPEAAARMPYTQPAHWRQLAFLGLVSFLSWLAYAVSQPSALPALLARRASTDADASAAVTAVGVGMGAATSAVMQALLAHMDLVRRKPPLVAACGGMALLPAVVLAAPAAPLWPLLLMASATGLVSNWPTIIAVVSTAVADHTSEADRSYVFGLFEVVTFAALVVGPALGGRLADGVDDMAPFAAGALAGVAAGCVAMAAYREPPDEVRRALVTAASSNLSPANRAAPRCAARVAPWLFTRRSPLRIWVALAERGRERACVALALAVGWLARGGTTNVQVLSMARLGWSDAAIGDVFTVGYLASALSMIGLTRAARAGGLSERTVVVMGFGLSALGLATQALASAAGSASGFVAGVGIQHLGSVYQPVARGMLSRLAGRGEQGEVMGAVAGLEMLLWWLPMLLLEPLYDAMGATTLAISAAGYVVAAALTLRLVEQASLLASSGEGRRTALSVVGNPTYLAQAENELEAAADGADLDNDLAETTRLVRAQVSSGDGDERA